LLEFLGTLSPIDREELNEGGKEIFELGSSELVQILTASEHDLRNEKVES